MSYKIQEIQGIGPAYAEKLIAAGITTSDLLLEKGQTPKGRKELEEADAVRGKTLIQRHGNYILIQKEILVYVW